jgi:hypothetical protein
VFRAEAMPLQAQPLTGINDDPLDFVIGLVTEHAEIPPGTTILYYLLTGHGELPDGKIELCNTKKLSFFNSLRSLCHPHSLFQGQFCKEAPFEAF